MSRVFVAGSINMDVIARAKRHPRIGETVAGEEVLFCPGGKGANQAIAAARLGAPTILIGRLGKDAFGEQLKAFLAAQGVELSFVQQSPSAHTGTAIITVADADNTIIVIPGANALVTADDIAAPILTKGDIAISQFEIPMPAIETFFRRARAAGATTILNPAPAAECSRELFDLADILVLNETELAFLAGLEVSQEDEYSRLAKGIRSLQYGHDKIVCLTLGKRGVLALINDQPLIVAGHPVDVVDTTGAGDCFIGALAAQLVAGSSFGDAVTYANTAASICVQTLGAAVSMPSSAEVDAITMTHGRGGQAQF